MLRIAHYGYTSGITIEGCHAKIMFDVLCVLNYQSNEVGAGIIKTTIVFQ